MNGNVDIPMEQASDEGSRVLNCTSVTPSPIQADDSLPCQLEDNHYGCKNMALPNSYSTPFKKRKLAVSIKMTNLSFDEPDFCPPTSTPALNANISMTALPKPDLLSVSSKKRSRRLGDSGTHDESTGSGQTLRFILKSPSRKAGSELRETKVSFHILNPMSIIMSLQIGCLNNSQNGSSSDPWCMLDRTLVEPLNEQLDAERLCTIGNGDTGRAVKCRDKDGSLFVLKCYSKIIGGAFDLARNIKEAAALSKLHHFNIVQYMDSFVHENYLYMKIEYCSGLNLRSIIDKYLENKTYPFESEIKSFLSQMIGALHHIHAQGIIHYDIKPDNIFTIDFNLCADNSDSGQHLPQMVYKIGDFGQCCIPGLLNIEICEGDSRYIGRETLEFIEEHLSINRESSFFPSPFSDIFALGLTTAEYCICGDLPSFGVEWHTIRNGKLPPISDKYSPALLDLLTAMIRNEPTDRPSAETILNCPYLNS